MNSVEHNYRESAEGSGGNNAPLDSFAKSQHRMKMNERLEQKLRRCTLVGGKKLKEKYFKALGINCFNESTGLMIVCGSRFETVFIRVTIFCVCETN